MSTRRFILLDRDGTIIEERHYLSDPGKVKLLPNASAGLKLMTKLGFGLVVVTNQSGIGRGYFSEKRLNAVHDRMLRLLLEDDVVIDGVYYCPHTPEERCACRKPLTALVDEAAESLKFRPRDCIVIGDKACDIEMGRNIDATTMLVRTGYGGDYKYNVSAEPHYTVDDLLKAAFILQKWSCDYDNK